jgi:phage-related protein
LFTASQAQSQAAIAKAAVQSATASLGNANNAYQNAVSQAITNVTACFTNNGIMAPVMCGMPLANVVITSIQNAFNAAFQSFTNLLGSSTSAIETVTSTVNSAVQQIQQTITAATSQATPIVQQAKTCISQAVSSAAASANATATNATAPLG